MTAECPFCELPEDRIVVTRPKCVAVRDLFPVTELHTLVIPRRHVHTYFELGADELSDIHQMTVELRASINLEDPAVTGFNLGWNCGVSAGQTVMHAHLHLIPRRDGDIDDPRGGVRGVIPGRQAYSIESP